MSLDKFIEERITKPLKMGDTAFEVSIALPPPTATRPSASDAASVAAATTSSGA